MRVATHSGPFHADDVFAWSLVKLLVDPGAELIRTRDAVALAAADWNLDVGGEHDPDRGRFDHHQASYTGDRSTAGLVLDHLERTGGVSPRLAAHLRRVAVDYLDAVDCGRRAPDPSIPCFPRLVADLVDLAEDEGDFDRCFLQAAEVATLWLKGMIRGFHKREHAFEEVRRAMAEAESENSRCLWLRGHVAWKEAYFELGGAQHPTDFVAFSGGDGTWRLVCIPPTYGSFGKKHPLPAAWAGLSGQALEAASGIPGAVFCHRNRFLAVFQTRQGLAAGLAAALAGPPA